MIKLALIGTGRMGRNYLATTSDLKNAAINYICTKTKASLNQFPKNYVKLTNYEEIINYPIDGVIIAAPSAVHFEISSFFLNRKIPVLIEKPLTTNYKDALKLLKIQQKTKTPVLVGHTLLYHPAYQKMKKLLPKISPVKSLIFEGANNAPRVDSSVIYDWGPHAIAFFLDLLDSVPPDNIKTLKAIKDSKGTIIQANIQLLFPKNINANMIISWKSLQKKRQLTITGKNGTLIFDSIERGSLIFQKPSSAHPVNVNFSSEKPLKLEVMNFINLIKDKSAIKSDLEFGVKVIEILSQSEQLFQEKS